MQIVYKVRVKQNFIDEFKGLAINTLIPEAYKLPGCEKFLVYQEITDSSEFIFHEIWKDEESVHTYKQNLIEVLGEPHPGEEFPAKMNDMIEADEDLV